MENIKVSTLLELGVKNDEYVNESKKRREARKSNINTEIEVMGKKVETALQKLIVSYNKNGGLSSDELDELDLIEKCLHAFEARNALEVLPFGKLSSDEKNPITMYFEALITLLLNDELKKSFSKSDDRYLKIATVIEEKMRELSDQHYVMYVVGNSDNCKNIMSETFQKLFTLGLIKGVGALLRFQLEAIKFLKFIVDYNNKRTISEYVDEKQKIVGIYDKIKPNIDAMLSNQDSKGYKR